MFCAKCGVKLSDDALFCKSCGKAVSQQPKTDITVDEHIIHPADEVKKICGSTLILILAISLTAACILSIFSKQTYQVYLSLPCLAFAVGVWMTYIFALNKGEKPMKTGGFKVIEITSIACVGLCVIGVLYLIGIFCFFCFWGIIFSLLTLSIMWGVVFIVFMAIIIISILIMLGRIANTLSDMVEFDEWEKKMPITVVVFNTFLLIFIVLYALGGELDIISFIVYLLYAVIIVCISIFILKYNKLRVLFAKKK